MLDVFLRNLESSFLTDSLSWWMSLASLFLVLGSAGLSILSVWKKENVPHISPFFSIPFYSWPAEGFKKWAHWHPPLHQRRPQRVVTDASWVMSLTALCLGSLSASPPSSFRQLQLRPVSTSPSEQNWFPWGIYGWTVLSWHWVSSEGKQKVHSYDRDMKENERPPLQPKEFSSRRIILFRLKIAPFI